MPAITTKSMWNRNSVRATRDSVGDWDGQEDLAAQQINRIYDALYEAAPDEYNDDQLSELMHCAWDVWGSEGKLLVITDDAIEAYVGWLV